MPVFAGFGGKVVVGFRGFMHGFRGLCMVLRVFTFPMHKLQLCNMVLGVLCMVLGVLSTV